MASKPYWQSWSAVTYALQAEITQELKSKLKEIRVKYQLKLEELGPNVKEIDCNVSEQVFNQTMCTISSQCSEDIIHGGLSIRKLQRILGLLSQSLRNNFSQSWCFN